MRPTAPLPRSAAPKAAARTAVLPARAALGAVGIALMLAASIAQAGTTWLCGLSGDLTRLVCLADPDPQAESEDGPRPATARVRGTQFPLDPRQHWVVDLWSPASDVESVALLARATICYRSPGCEVILNAPELAAAASTPVSRPPRRR